MARPNLENDNARLKHMLEFAQKAVTFVKGRKRADLDSNEMLAMAIIHSVELIGEASYSISEERREKHPEIPWHDIAGTRNRLAHGYIDVNLDVIWTIVTKDLPPLIKQLKRILGEKGRVRSGSRAATRDDNYEGLATSS